MWTQQNGAGGGKLQETALSFTGVVTIITFCCCSTMSCVALCIKCVSWMVGHRGRRRRIFLLPEQGWRPDLGQNDDEEDGEELCPCRTPRTVIVLNTIPAEQRNGRVLQTSEIELREVPFGNIEEQQQQQRRRPGGNGDAAVVGAKGFNMMSGKQGQAGGLRLQRERTGGSTMTRTGTPSMNGELERTPSSSSCEGNNQGEGEDSADENRDAELRRPP